ncbi:MAG: hypothetical protein ACQEWG_10370 [Bacteroidota bacterium]
MDRLIDLIEEGDPSKILSEEDLFTRFNELVRYGLVVLEDEKVFLTKKGIQAKKEGVELFIKREKFAHIQDEYLRNETFNKEKKGFFKKLKSPKLIQWGILMILLALAFGNKLFELKIRNTFKK